MKRSGDEKTFRKISAIKDSILMNKKIKERHGLGIFFDRLYTRISFTTKLAQFLLTISVTQRDCFKKF